MKTTLKKMLTLTAMVVAFLTLSSSKVAAQTQWTYTLSTNNITYKIFFASANGNMTIQFYNSTSNKWNYGTILSQETPANSKVTYYKAKASNGLAYEMWATGNDCVVKTNGGKWTYNLESSK